jgi:molybdate transport system ATP-binding protein
MSLDATFRVRQGAFVLDASVHADAGTTLAILGPNGAGKTTVLRALAGLVPLAGGRVTLEGEVLEDAAVHTWRPPDARRVGFVFQERALFPHLSVLANVAFGLRARGVPRGQAHALAREWLVRVGLSGFEQARPATLSGGQAQRAALARALAPDPRLLLLDEPLEAVDAPARLELRRTLRERLHGFSGVRVLVTHDPLEAAALADRVAILEAGALVQEGVFSEVTARPRSPWVARMAGVNLLRGVAAEGSLRLDTGALAVASDVRGPALATIHPRAIAVHREPPTGSPRNVIRGTVAGIDREGDRWRVRITGSIDLVAEVTPAAAAELHLADGGVVYAAVKATEVDVYPV